MGLQAPLLWLLPVALLVGVAHGGAAAHAPGSAPRAPPQLDWLADQAADLLTKCTIAAHDGTVLFTPDASGSYGAQWTRDFAYMLAADGGSVFVRANISVETVRRAVQYQFRAQRADGCMPDRVQADGVAVFSPGAASAPFADHAIDNMPFSALLLTAFMAFASPPSPAVAASSVPTQAPAAGGLAQQCDLFCALEPQVRRAMDFLVRRDALVFNDGAHPNCTYGFTDTVAKAGRLLFSSLLAMQASRDMAGWSTRCACGGAAQWANEAAAAGSAVAARLFDARLGLFVACDAGPNVLPDVWGSALAVHLGVATGAQAGAVVAQLAAQVDAVFQQGQVRHLPAPLVWGACFAGACPTPGTYQNGAYWATPLAWVLPVLQAHGQAALAGRLAAQALAAFQADGITECVNADLHYHGVLRYVASATNALAGMRTVPPPPARTAL
mmetsp:Transcript_19294/g.49048  ORF Transcript_19294/g.49048 Transcript_19294/m.49048 type:complete len:442 (+) Transcript_19294:139-1464(+)